MLNVYDPGLLRKLGYKGWKMLEAARDAISRKRPGVIHYQFLRTPLLEKITSAWQKVSDALKEENHGAAKPQIDIDADVEVLAKFACQLLANRPDLIAGWQTAASMLAVPGELASENDPTRPGGKVISGSVKMVSVNASNELLQKLGL
jgi:hypothetical protein